MGIVNTGTPRPKGPRLRVKPRSCILVVDDDYFFVDLVEDTLGEDSDVIYASNATMALEIASQRQPDVILLDVMMPEIHGYEVCRRLKAHHQTKYIPVIFLTSLGEASSQKIGLDLGAAEHVTKPFDPAKLKTLIDSKIKQRHAMHKQRRWRTARTKVLHLMRFWRQDSLL
jgi:putative two-component system response regulator